MTSHLSRPATWRHCLLPGFAGFAVALTSMAGEFPLMCVVDYRDPVPPELLKQAGIQRVYATVGLPVTSDKDGTPVLAPKVRPQLEAMLNLYREHGIKVLLATHYFGRPPEGTEAVDGTGRRLRMACLRHPDFRDWMSEKINLMVRTLERYPAFDGFLFDDGVHVRCDACYCSVCRTGFKEKHGLEPPPFTPYTGPARVDPADPRLLWDAFHRRSYAGYLRTQARAAQAPAGRRMLLTIPSDSYYIGRQLSRNIQPEATSLRSNARLQRIDRIQVRDWYVFQSFPVPTVMDSESGREAYGVGTHLTTPSPVMVLHHGGPYLDHMGRQQFLGPAEIRRVMHCTIAEGAAAICFWENARAFGACPDAFDAIGEVAREASRLDDVLQAREPLPARVGLLYSTTTEIMQQAWTGNTMERWRHLHAFDAMAYALTRASVAFRVILEPTLRPDTLESLDVLLLTGVTQLTKPSAVLLESAVATGKLTLMTDAGCLKLKGARRLTFDQDAWYEKQLKGYRQPVHLDRQARDIREHLLSELDLSSLQPATVSSHALLAKIFRDENQDLLVFLVNWDLERETRAQLRFDIPRRLRDCLGKEVWPQHQTHRVTVEPAGWRVLHCR